MSYAILSMITFGLLGFITAWTARRPVGAAIATSVALGIVVLTVLGYPRPARKVTEVYAAHFGPKYVYAITDGLLGMPVTLRIRMSDAERSKLRNALRRKAQNGGHGKVVMKKEARQGQPVEKVWIYVKPEEMKLK